MEITSWHDLINKLKTEIHILGDVYHDPRIPWYTRALLAVLLAYLLSPIDLIPDFIPVLGYLDDVILIPLLIWLVLRLTPPIIIEEARYKAHNYVPGAEKHNWLAAGIIMALWAVVLIGMGSWIWRWYRS